MRREVAERLALARERRVGVALRAVAYIRVSGVGQVDRDGPDRQRLAVAEYARVQGMELVREYFDAGVSGAKDLADRPALLELMDSEGIDVVLVEKLDRLARDVVIQESLLRKFGERRMRLVSVTEPDLCGSDPTRKFIRQVLGAFYELEREMIVMKLSAARRRMKEQGKRCEGRKPFGSHPGEEVVLSRIEALAEGGMSAKVVAETLNREGLKSRYGGDWHAAVVRRIMRRAA